MDDNGRGEPSAYSQARERTFELRARHEGHIALKVADWITRPQASPGEREDGDIKYSVQVFTGEMRKAGTDSDVYITLVGELGGGVRDLGVPGVPVPRGVAFPFFVGVDGFRQYGGQVCVP